ncbi:hypothetical protein PybrP1_000324 [[Pythium] brassicae (nom. inval.)]|nr:hypothetical protein PybrP1_000324 [[Pythium] brassicae (nom. inval.)]
MASPDARRRAPTLRHRLDVDPSRLTSFPMPGSMEPPAFQKEPMSERPSTHTAMAANNVPAPPHSTGNQQYWMPDHLCKVCYDCGIAFSLFRRRHHCRLCGQIFCFECSGQFIDGAPHGHKGEIRVCKFCARFVEEVERKKALATAQRRTSLSRGSSLGVALTLPDLQSSVDLDTVSPLLCIPSTSLAADAGVSRAISTLSSFDSFDSGSATNSFLDSPPSPTEGGDRVPTPLPPLFTIQSSESLDVDDELDERIMQRPFPPRPQHRRRRSSVELLGAIESGGLLESDLQQLKAAAQGSGQRVSFAGDAPMSFRMKSDVQTQREIGLGKYMQDAHDRIRAGITRAVEGELGNLQAQGDQFDPKRLATSLEDIAFVVAGHLLFSMNFRGANGFNYARLVKVKSIAMAETVQKNNAREPFLKFHFKWLAGTLCRKHLSHKMMARQVANPRILLFACGISYDRSAGAGKLNSLDTLIEQEKSYMNILVDKITALEPDVIFVERTVSRHAQELLRARRVGIVLNVKFEILERISRHTGAALLTSVDHVDKSRAEDVVGTCRSFLVKTVPIVPDEDEGAAAAGASSASALATSPSVATKAKTETYLYLDGCDPLNGCTVLLTGPSKPKLRVLKRLTRAVLSMTYRLLLEAHVLSDLDSHGSAFTLAHDHALSGGAGSGGLGPAGVAAADDAAAGTNNTTWYTTCTLRVRESASTNIRYHPCTGCKYFGIQAYSEEDISFGNFLGQEMSALLLKCQSPKCNYPMADHVQTFSCRSGTIMISFEQLPLESRLPIFESLNQSDDSDASLGKDSGGHPSRTPALMTKLLGRDVSNVMAMLTGIYDPPALESSGGGSSAASERESYPTIVFWRWCRECSGMVTPFVPLDKYVYKYSFARFLEIMFFEGSAAFTPAPRDAAEPSCHHSATNAHVLFFNIGDWVARFDFTAKVPLQLARASEQSSVRGDESLEEEHGIELGVLRLVIAKRLVEMKQLLDALIKLFTEKVQGIKQAVEAFEKADDCLQMQIVLEVVCLSKLIKSDQHVFLHKIERLEAKAENCLAECDAAQRAMYLLACRWIDRMLKLRKLIKKNLSKEATAAMSSSSFTLAGFSFSTPTTLSPIASPRSRDDTEHSSSLAPSAISRDTSDFQWETKERTKRGSSDALSINGSELSPESSIVSSAASSFTSLESGKKTPLNHSYERVSMKHGSDQKETSQSSWRTALWDLYRVLGRNSPGSDFHVELPEALLAGHPSLPYRSGDNVVLVNNSEPITCVAYALSSDLYDEHLDSWKLLVHKEVAASVAPKLAPTRPENTPAVVQTNWSRAALETPLNTPFKYAISERPLHVSLLSGEHSAAASSSPWEFSTIAYYPLQFEVLRELFFGSLDDFLFSIAHVSNWDANGGKSGASFYRTLDDRFVVKHISSTEMQSFLEVLPGYFKYMSKVYFEGTPSVISKTVGLFQTMITRKETGQKTIHYISVMENAFAHTHTVCKYDLKGSSRNRYIRSPTGAKKKQQQHHHHQSAATPTGSRVLLDGNLLEYSRGHPLGVLAEGHSYLVNAVKNDAAFLNSINIVDYSMVVGIGEQGAVSTEMTVGVIDYYRQFDLIKRVESVSKSVGMIAGQSSPTIIEPALYGKRFEDAINRYFMPVSPVSSNENNDDDHDGRRAAGVDALHHG